MLSVSRHIVLLAALSALFGCASTSSDHSGLPQEEFAELKVAIRKVTSSPVKYCSRVFDEYDRPVAVYVWTEDGKSYSAVKTRGKWYFREAVFVG
jgi:hypothetical protein